MSRDSVDKFIKKLSLDEALQDRLIEFGMGQGLKPGTGRLSQQQIVDFADLHGFDVTLDELRSRNLAVELADQKTAPLMALPQPGARPKRDSSAWWAWLGD
jgi:hypothetical protein